MWKIIVFAVLIPLSAFSDVIFLKTGASISGKLLELNEQTIVIEKDNHDQVTFSLQYIQAVIDEDYNLLFGELTPENRSFLEGMKQTIDTMDNIGNGKSIKDDRRIVDMKKIYDSKIGIKLGVNFANMLFSPDEDLNTETIVRFFGGFTKTGRNSKNCGYAFDIYYVSRGSQNSGHLFYYDISYSEDVFLSYLGVNFNLRIYLTPSPSSPFIEYGIVREVCVAKDYKFESNIDSYTTDNLDVGTINSPLIFGIGTGFSLDEKHEACIQLRYYLGTDNISEEEHRVEIRTSDIALTLAVLF